MNFEHILLMCACPDEAVAARLAQALVEEKLAACVNRMAVRSTYAWQGRIEDEPEVLLLIKTRSARFGEVEARIQALHPYEVPEIIALPIVAGAQGYLAWLERESGAAPPAPTETAR